MAGKTGMIQIITEAAKIAGYTVVVLILISQVHAVVKPAVYRWARVKEEE